MLARLKQFFDEHIAGEISSGNDETHALQLATAALLVEIMLSDDDASSQEQGVVIDAVKEKFSLSDQEAQSLIDLAHDELRDSVDYHQFTSLINASFEYSQKVTIVEFLWQIAFADGVLDRYEEHTIRKISDLLYVRHSDFIAAKHKVSPD